MVVNKVKTEGGESREIKVPLTKRLFSYSVDDKKATKVEIFNLWRQTDYGS